MAALTQLRGAGHPGRRYGAFVAATPAATPLTQLRGAGHPGRRYGRFVAATPAASATAADYIIRARRIGRR